ncbi:PLASMODESMATA CALLOSE-BINDING PROTEIN 2 [Prunus persica]|nr:PLASMODESMATA CALLOSE-BINDING PROTEIN 2 [Prunus persica]
MLVNGQKSWCVAKPAAPQHALQSALDYACNYADCSPTKKGGSCYDPDRPVHHVSFAMNAYYQKMGRNQWNCHLNNTSLISLADPSYNPCCQFVSGGSGPPLPQEKEVLVIVSMFESAQKENGNCNLVVAGVRMNIGVTFKRYRAIKEVGKIIMSVGVIAYYQLMQVCQAEYFRQLLKPVT